MRSHLVVVWRAIFFIDSETFLQGRCAAVYGWGRKDSPDFCEDVRSMNDHTMRTSLIGLEKVMCVHGVAWVTARNSPNA